MTDIYSAICDDIAEYLDACKQLKVEPVFVNGTADCYGEHAKQVLALVKEKESPMP